MKKKFLSDVVNSDYIELSKDSQGLLRGGFGSVKLPEGNDTIVINNCKCNGNNCLCFGSNNCDCNIITSPDGGKKNGNPEIGIIPELF